MVKITFSSLLKVCLWKKETKQKQKNKTKKRTMAVFTLETDNSSSKFVKIDGKKMDKVRRIVHPKLRPFCFQIKTYYLSDANYPTA